MTDGRVLGLYPHTMEGETWPEAIPRCIDNAIRFNWTWKLPWPADAWMQEDEPLSRADQLREWTRRNHR